jgi:toxin YhaV
MVSSHRRSVRSSPAIEPVTVVNGWSLYAHPLFIDQFQSLLEEVEHLRAAHPNEYRDKKKTKLLAAIFKMTFEIIPQNPADRSFWLGNTLGAEYRHWHRGKFFEGRYRLFFRYSLAEKIIVLAWVNDEETLRTYGGKFDAYAVFKKMLDKDRPPDGWETLLNEAKKAVPRTKEILERGKEAK